VANQGDAAIVATEAGDANSDPLPSAAQIAERSVAFAAGMREVTRVEGTAPIEADLVRAAEKDICARAAFVAESSVVARLVDGKGSPLVELAPATTGILGPACVRQSGSIVLRVLPEGDAAVTRVRAVAWISP
jgi:hypothetical protein